MSTAKPRFRFETIYKGPYVYPSGSGVGICLTGTPTDERLFCEMLIAVSCSPPAALRIYSELKAGLSKRTTVTESLNFNEIARNLRTVGVSLSIVPPGEPADQRMDHAALYLYRGRELDLSEFSDEEQEIIRQRKQNMADTVPKLGLSLGAFK